MIYSHSQDPTSPIAKASREWVEKVEGIDVWEGPCEDCKKRKRLVFEPKLDRYLCGDCLEKRGFWVY